ncbi:MAG: tail fiber protein [Bacteroidota bacterium]
MFAGLFAPVNWAFCHGQLLTLEDYQPLFSVIGVTYGGNGRTDFALPNIKSRVPVGIGEGPGLPLIRLAQEGGEETATMTIPHMPTHTHVADISTDQILMPVSIAQADENAPNEAFLTTQTNEFYSSEAANNQFYGSGAVAAPSFEAASTGEGKPFSIISPSLVTNFIICHTGVYPQRD